MQKDGASFLFYCVGKSERPVVSCGRQDKRRSNPDLNEKLSGRQTDLSPCQWNRAFSQVTTGPARNCSTDSKVLLRTVGKLF